MNIVVNEGEMSTVNARLNNHYIKKGMGTLVFSKNVKTYGSITVQEGAIRSEGELTGTLNVGPGALFISATVAGMANNSGDVQIGLLTDLFPSSLRLTSLTETSVTQSVLSVKVFPTEGGDSENCCDFLRVEDAILTGNLNVYVAPGNYDAGGERYPIIRSSAVNRIVGDFISLINVNQANVRLTYERDDTNYYLVVSGNTPYVTPTPTSYTSGRRLNVNQRHDQLKIGCTGGFSGFSTPEEWCEVLFTSFIQTGTLAEQNTVLTNSYDGTTSLTYLPETVKEWRLTGDPTGYDILVRGGRQFALPTPAANTRIRFGFTKSPASNPLGWFQGALPEGCSIVIDPGSADPFIDSIIPQGGYMVVGSPITLRPGVAQLFADLYRNSIPFSIQKHPEVVVDEASITLTEPTVFPGIVAGIKLQGGYSSTFTSNSSLFNIEEGTALAGIRAIHCAVKLYRTPDYTMTRVNSYTESGNVFEVSESIDRALMPNIPSLREYS